MKHQINRKKVERPKAFIGAAIGAVASIAGGIISRNKQKKAERKARIEQNRTDTLESAQAMSSSYANQDYVDDYNKKITLRYGGKTNTNAYDNRFKNDIKLRRKTKNNRNKKAIGGINKISNIEQTDLTSNNNIFPITSGVSNINNALTQNSNISQQPNVKDNVSSYTRKDNIENRDYNINTVNTNNLSSSQVYGDRLAQLRIGGRKTTKRR